MCLYQWGHAKKYAYDSFTDTFGDNWRLDFTLYYCQSKRLITIIMNNNRFIISTKNPDIGKVCWWQEAWQ